MEMGVPQIGRKPTGPVPVRPRPRAFAACLLLVCSAAFPAAPRVWAQQGTARPGDDPAAPTGSAQIQQEKPGPQRIPRQTRPDTGTIEGIIRQASADNAARPLAGALVTVRNLANGEIHAASADGGGVFRLLQLPAGDYELKVEAAGFEPLGRPKVPVAAGELVIIEVSLVSAAATVPTSRVPERPELGPPLPAPLPAITATYREWRRRPDWDPNYEYYPLPEVLVPDSQIYSTLPDRWHPEMPPFRRYAVKGEFPYVTGHLYNSFNRNRLKGDYPIWPEVFGPQTFFDLTATSSTFMDGRYVPSPSGLSTAQPGSSEFFGKGGQYFLDQTFRISMNLFHGDAGFRQPDWRIQFTPEASLNYLSVQELGIVGPSPLNGTTRFDTHVGLQEGFFEAKLADLSPNYDFISMRAGIQQFSSDFRGFLYVDSQPGLRIFGIADNNKWQFNAAYFYLLEKNTNSGLNTFDPRDQQVIIGNFYRSDFLVKGYTMELVGAWNKDDGGLHYNDNGVLVRPAPVGTVIGIGSNPGAFTHGIRVGYFGWLGSGHLGKINITHAFYEAAGEDSLNPIAGRKVTVNAQFAAVELSLDRDWIRYRISGLYSSGDKNPRSGRATGFDSIVDAPDFAGGIFSFWNREGIRLTGSGLALTPDESLLANLRSDKVEGQANFVNPGLYLVNAGTDIDLTPKARLFLNLNYLRFDRTEPLQEILFQRNIRHDIGMDYSVGVRYRPPLSENIVLTFGASGLSPMDGFRDIYTGRQLWSVFTKLDFVF